MPRRILSAIAVVLDIALLARAKPLPAKTLAARYDLAPRQFEPLLQDLVRGGILRSLRGPRGGYELARERRRISLGDILRTIDATQPNATPPRAIEAELIGSVIEPALAEAKQAFLARLDAISVEDLCRRVEDGEKRHESPAAADFHI